MGTLDHILYNYRNPMDKGAWRLQFMRSQSLTEQLSTVHGLLDGITTYFV